MQYQVIPVRQELIPPMYATDVTIGKPYDVVSAKTTEGGYFIGGNVTLNSGATYYIEPDLYSNGFVVKRVYVEDADETDPNKILRSSTEVSSNSGETWGVDRSIGHLHCICHTCHSRCSR